MHPQQSTRVPPGGTRFPPEARRVGGVADRKSTRLNSSHSQISYGVFCLEKQELSGSEDLLALAYSERNDNTVPNGMAVSDRERDHRVVVTIDDQLVKYRLSQHTLLVRPP